MARKRSRKPNRETFKEERSKFDSKDRDTSTDNDVTWYLPNGIVASNVGSISFNNPVGYPVNDGDVYLKTPGLMSINWNPSLGYSAAAYSPVNVAAKNLYSFVRHANSGHTNYEAPDLMMYCIAVAQAYAYHADLVRIYGCLNVASSVNRYIPAAMAQACGADYDDMTQHMPDLLWYINQYALKLSAFALPAEMSIVKRWVFMNSNVYTDADNIKTQMYLYRQSTFWKLDETTSSTGTSLQKVSNTYKKTFDQAMTIGDTLLNALLQCEDAGIMSGDILKAYGQEHIYNITMIPDTYSVIPTYNPEVLQQMHNTRFAGQNCPLPTVTQDTNGVILVPQELTKATDLSTVHNHVLIDTFLSEPKPEDVIVMSRMALAENSTNSFPMPIYSGSEVATSATITYYNGDLTPTNLTYSTIYGYVSLGTSGSYSDTTLGAAMTNLAIWEAFDYAPMLKFGYLSNSTTFKDAVPVWTTNNVVRLDTEYLQRMHETAILAELSVPAVALVK